MFTATPSGTSGGAQRSAAGGLMASIAWSLPLAPRSAGSTISTIWLDDATSVPSVP